MCCQTHANPDPGQLAPSDDWRCRCSCGGEANPCRRQADSEDLLCPVCRNPPATSFRGFWDEAARWAEDLPDSGYTSGSATLPQGSVTAGQAYRIWSRGRFSSREPSSFSEFEVPVESLHLSGQVRFRWLSAAEIADLPPAAP